jgi:glycosyltransferase involved in cell wall biosynthesis
VRVLALEPYYGGSHRAFLDGWQALSRHEWTVLGLPAFKWKWRMRHAPVTFAEELAARVAKGEAWDVLFCSDMLNLPVFLGLAPKAVRELPSVLYFHENQITYPYQDEDDRDYHYGFANLWSGLAASQLWFNSVFHRDDLLGAIPGLLDRMPDYQPAGIVERLRAKASVQPPGVVMPPGRSGRVREPGPMHILWAARWEFDKGPDTFFEALALLKEQGVPFRLSVIGQQFRNLPPAFHWAEQEFAEQIVRWGYQDSRSAYEAALAEADVIVSSAQHEFFGITLVEAVAAGCYPLVPRRLAYPEVLGELEAAGHGPHFYDGGAEALAAMLGILAERVAHDDLWQGDPERGVRAVERYRWPMRASGLDAALEAACSNPKPD